VPTVAIDHHGDRTAKEETVPHRIVVLNPPPEASFQYESEALVPLGARIEVARVATDNEAIASVRSAEIVIPMGMRLTAAVIASLDDCRLIPSGGIGVDHIDVEAATAKGILVTNMYDTFVEEVANHAWMLLLMAARSGVWLHESVVNNRWREAIGELFPIQRRPMPRVTGQTLGLISFGRISRAVARRGHAFGMTVLGFDPFVPDAAFAENGVERIADLHDLFARSDFVSCHLPLTPTTHHYVQASHFARSRKGLIFISTGRGKVIDEAALIAALRSGTVAAAGLDVLEEEPPAADNPLLSMPNVTLSPHMASVSDVSSVERRRLMGRQIADVLRGTVPVGVVNPSIVEAWRERRPVAP